MARGPCVRPASEANTDRGSFVPRLVIMSDGVPVPTRRNTAAASPQLWRDAEGTTLASCDTIDGQRRVDVARVGAFHVDPLSRTVSAYPRNGVPAVMIDEAYTRWVLPIVLQAHGTEVLHASAVRLGGIVALCGDSRVGKSTLAFALGRRGHQVWADDAVAFGLRSSSAVAFALPFETRLRPQSAEFFGVRARMDRTLLYAPPDDRPRPSEAPLTAVFVLRRSEADPGGIGVRVERLRPPTAVPALLAHAYCFSLEDPDLKRAMVAHYVDLAARVPVFALRFRTGLEMLPPMLDRIEAVGRSVI
jgi:hypothetical protein